MKIGVLGAGHMGSAMIRGLANQYNSSDIFVKGHQINAQLLALQKEIGFQIMENNDFSAVDILIVATPATKTVEALDEVTVGTDTIIISTAQGVRAKGIKNIFPHNSVICIIPNIPVAVNAGCIAVQKGETATPADTAKANEVLSSLGTLIQVTAEDLGSVGTVAGCGPAFVDVFLSALSDAAVQNGLDRKTAYQVAASMVTGSAKMALDTALNPAVLKDQVTSPGGSTIKGVVALDANGFRNAVNQAVNQAYGSDKKDE